MAYRLEDPVDRSPPSTDAGERIYAIGDVHGRFDLLSDLLDRLEAHSRALPAARSIHILLLGDLIDRGAESAKVLRFALDADRRSGQIITLLGNHEDLMLRALKGEEGMMRAWLRAGGRETLRSFGIEPPERGADQTAALTAARARIPRDLVEWLRKRPLTARSGDYLFCHAGIRPGVAIKRQARADLLWIRDEFLEDSGDHGVVVVHGHSVANDVEERANRIGIDTGAYRSGVLTALYLEGTKREFLSTAATASAAGVAAARG